MSLLRIAIPEEVQHALRMVLPVLTPAQAIIAARVVINSWPDAEIARRGTVYTNTWQEPGDGEQFNIMVIPVEVKA